jgi:hypothetical protein
MLDLAAGMETRNYTLKRTTDLQTLLESLKAVFPLAMIAGALCFHIWIQGQNIHIGYRTQQFKEREEMLSRIQKHLIVEEQALMDPKLLEEFARNELNMIILPANQIIPAPLDTCCNGLLCFLVLCHLRKAIAIPGFPACRDLGLCRTNLFR